ncbi:unnamed protein product [Calypogeia fissa]
MVDSTMANFEAMLVVSEVQGQGLLLLLFLGERDTAMGGSWCPGAFAAAAAAAMATAHLIPLQQETLFTIASQRRRPTPCGVVSASTNPRNRLPTLPETLSGLMNLQLPSDSWYLLRRFRLMVSSKLVMSNVFSGNRPVTFCPCPCIIYLLAFAHSDCFSSRNEIKELPTHIGPLKSLRILAMFGNLLSSVPESLTNLSTLDDLWLQV